MVNLVKTPWWLKVLLPKELIWEMPAAEKPAVYLTFDDGPHPTATPFVLDQLDAYQARATFFCIGKNVVEQPDIYKKLLDKGHTVCNHTNNHMNGWKTDDATYIDNINQASKLINSRSLRPPYGRIKYSQVKKLSATIPIWKIYMWTVLSMDFDKTVTPQQCAKNVTDNLTPGAIVVFHDSTKAWENMSFALPEVLQFCQKNNWELKALPQY